MKILAVVGTQSMSAMNIPIALLVFGVYGIFIAGTILTGWSCTQLARPQHRGTTSAAVHSLVTNLSSWKLRSLCVIGLIAMMVSLGAVMLFDAR